MGMLSFPSSVILTKVDLGSGLSLDSTESDPDGSPGARLGVASAPLPEVPLEGQIDRAGTCGPGHNANGHCPAIADYNSHSLASSRVAPDLTSKYNKRERRGRT